MLVKPPKKCESVLKYHCEPRKYQCSQCTEKFLFPQRLAEHVKSVHKESLDNSCLVCAKNFKTQTILEKHLKIHTGDLYQCDVCMKIFRNNHALQVHYASHNASHIKKNKALGWLSWHHAANLVLPVAKIWTKLFRSLAAVCITSGAVQEIRFNFVKLYGAKLNLPLFWKKYRVLNKKSEL